MTRDFHAGRTDPSGVVTAPPVLLALAQLAARVSDLAAQLSGELRQGSHERDHGDRQVVVHHRARSLRVSAWTCVG